MMKKTTTLLAGIGFALLCHAQIQDPGFESWTEKMVLGNTWMEPTEWFSYNESQVSIGLNKPVSRSTDAHSGTYALQVVSTVDDGNEQVGMCSSGKTFTGDLIADNSGERFALTGRINSFNGWYKYTPAIADDSFGVVMIFYRNNTYYGTAVFRGGATDTYKYFNWQLKYPDNIPQPDSAKFFIFSSSYSNLEGSTLLLDDMGISYKQATGIEEKPAQLSANVFPNPTTHTLTLSGLQYQPESYTIADLNGRLITSASYRNNSIDVQALEAGMYLLWVTTTDGNTLYSKFTKE